MFDPQRDQAELSAAREEARKEGRSEAATGAFGDKSIVVLPFVNVSSDPEQEYFADGVSEELLNLLAKLPNLRVISRTSSFQLKGTSDDIPTIGKRLNVAHVLEGSVRKSGNSIRITAQLIEVATDRQLWSETYDRTLNDVFAIQDEVATHVVDQLRVTFGGERPRATVVDARAYDLYLQARSIMNLFATERFPSAIDLLQQALEIEPRYVDALVQMGYAYQGLRDVENAEAAFGRAVAIDPDNPTPIAARALNRDDPFESALLLERAAKADPTNSLVLHNSARLYQFMGQLERAIEIYEYVVDRDPLFFWAHLNLADYYTHAGRLDDAVRHYDTALGLNSTAGNGAWKYGLALLIKGDAEFARQQFELEVGREYKMHGLALAEHDLGQFESAADKMRQLEESSSDNWPFGLARAYAWMGNADATFDYLDASVEKNFYLLGGLGRHPLFEKMHDDPRWLPFLRSIGQAPEQLAEFEFDIELPE